MPHLKCQNCGHTWNYTGTADVYASCPNCHYNVHIEKRTISRLADEGELDK